MLELINEWRGQIHLLLHVVVPLAVAAVFFHALWKKAFATMFATMLVDIDHLLATPIYQPDRCSIGFHPLHTEWPILIYFVLCAFPKTRLIGLGLVIHMLLDTTDCMWMKSTWDIASLIF